jgi:hypothetical protein
VKLTKGRTLLFQTDEKESEANGERDPFCRRCLPLVVNNDALIIVKRRLLRRVAAVAKKIPLNLYVFSLRLCVSEVDLTCYEGIN